MGNTTSCRKRVYLNETNTHKDDVNKRQKLLETTNNTTTMPLFLDILNQVKFDRLVGDGDIIGANYLANMIEQSGGELDLSKRGGFYLTNWITSKSQRATRQTFIEFLKAWDSKLLQNFLETNSDGKYPLLMAVISPHLFFFETIKNDSIMTTVVDWNYVHPFHGETLLLSFISIFSFDTKETTNETWIVNTAQKMSDEAINCISKRHTSIVSLAVQKGLVDLFIHLAERMPLVHVPNAILDSSQFNMRQDMKDAITSANQFKCLYKTKVEIEVTQNNTITILPQIKQMVLDYLFSLDSRG